MTIPVGIVALNFNQKRLVEDFTHELDRQSFRGFNLYLIDNGSDLDQQVDELAETYPWIRHIKNGQNLGFAGGNNVGIQRAIADGCKFIWIVNNDVRLEPDCLEKLVGYLTKHDDVGIVAPKIMYESDRNRIWYAGGHINWAHPFPFTVNTHIGEREIDHSQFDETRETEFVTGASMLCRTKTLLQSTFSGNVPEKHPHEGEFFDERYFAYFEDADLSLQVKKLGCKLIYYPTAKMYHMVGSLSGVTSPRSSYYQIRNSLLFVTEWGPWWSKLLAYANIPVMLAKNLVKFLIPSKRQFALAQTRAIRDFIHGRFGGPMDV